MPPLLLAASGLSSCLTYDGTRAIVPLLEVYEQPAKPWGPGKAAVPPDEAASQPSREYVLRPLGSYESIGESAVRRSRVKFLWPIGDYAWGQGDTRHWTMPLFYYRRKPIPEGGSDLDWFLLPFFFGGNDPREGAYFALFPVGGMIRGLLGKDETHFALFPLYWRWWEGEYDSMHLLVPFFNRVRGGGHSGWRLWPFWGSYAADRPEDGEPRYRRRFILWPFWITGQSNLDSRRPNELFFSLPFYGSSSNPNTETRVYLWPFFHTATDVETGHSLWFGYVIPYRFTGGQFDLWPLFGVKTRVESAELGGSDLRGIAGPGGRVNLARASDEDAALARPSSFKTRYRQFALWPLQRYDVDQGDTWDRRQLWLLPFFWHFHTLDKDRFETTSEWKLWPLWRYRRTPEETTLYFPSPLWFRQENLFERLYARLWRLFLYKDTPERSGWEVLWGLVSYRNEKAADERVGSILYGLLEWSGGDGGRGARFLWLPWR